MKITNIDSFIEEFRNGRDKWSRTAIELVVREIERLRKENNKLKLKLAASENDLVLSEVSEMLKKTQARVQELEQDLSDQSQKRLENAQVSTDRIIALEGKIRELEQERRWIPVSERLPEEGQPVLIDFGNNEITVGIWFWENEPEEWSNGTDYVGWQHWSYGWDKFFPSDKPPLHWQPLPQPPKEGE